MGDKIMPEGSTSEKLKALSEGLSEDSVADEVGARLRKAREAIGASDSLAKAGMEGDFVRAVAKATGRPQGELRAMIPKPPEPPAQKSNGGGMKVEYFDPPEHVGDVTYSQALDVALEYVNRYVILSHHQAVAVVLWCAYAHAHQVGVVQVSPILLLTSPDMRCGKTRTVKVVKRLVPRPQATSGITPAALFRIITAHRPTLLMDEFDRFASSVDRNTLDALIDGGHEEETAYALRADGPNFEVSRYSTWAPKLIAGIGKQNVAGTVSDRSIEIYLDRKREDEEVEEIPAKWEHDDGPAICSMLWACAHVHAEELKGKKPKLQGLNDRQQDNWWPLLAIADTADGKWPKLAREAARVLSTANPDDLPVRSQLLSDIWLVFLVNEAEHLETSTILTALHRMEDRPWAEFGRNARELSSTKLANLVKPFGIRPTQYKVMGQKKRGYHLPHFRESFERYLEGKPPEAPEAEEVSRSAGGSEQGRVRGLGVEGTSPKSVRTVPYAEVRHETGFSTWYPEATGTGLKIAVYPHKSAMVPSVPGCRGGPEPPPSPPPSFRVVAVSEPPVYEGPIPSEGAFLSPSPPGSLKVNGRYRVDFRAVKAKRH